MLFIINYLLLIIYHLLVTYTSFLSFEFSI